MTINPYTLNSLYEKGILDYVPVELYAPTPYGSPDSVGNPYLNMAQQGSLYQQQNNSNDSFSSANSSQNEKQQSKRNTRAHYRNQTSMRNSNNRVNNSFDSYNKANGSVTGTDQFSAARTDNYLNAEGINPYSSYSDEKRGKSGFVSKITNLPLSVKGLISGAILLGTLIFCFRGGKKAPAGSSSTSLWTKILKFLKIK